jgi:hypothetical protein
MNVVSMAVAMVGVLFVTLIFPDALVWQKGLACFPDGISIALRGWTWRL